MENFNSDNFKLYLLQQFNAIKPVTEIQIIKYNQLFGYISDSTNQDLYLILKPLQKALNNFKKQCEDSSFQIDQITEKQDRQKKYISSKENENKNQEQKEQQNNLKIQFYKKNVKLNEINKLTDDINILEKQQQDLIKQIAIKNQIQSTVKFNNYSDSLSDVLQEQFQQKSNKLVEALSKTVKFVIENPSQFNEQQLKKEILDKIQLKCDKNNNLQQKEQDINNPQLQDDQELQNQIKQFIQANGNLLVLHLMNIAEGESKKIQCFSQNLETSLSNFNLNQSEKTEKQQKYLREIKEKHLKQFADNEIRLLKIEEQEQQFNELKQKVYQKLKEQDHVIFERMVNCFEKDLKLIEKNCQLQSTQKLNSQINHGDNSINISTKYDEQLYQKQQIENAQKYEMLKIDAKEYSDISKLEQEKAKIIFQDLINMLNDLQKQLQNEAQMSGGIQQLFQNNQQETITNITDILKFKDSKNLKQKIDELKQDISLSQNC
ncbi:hypothetical protein PPERSA_12390 [Pseudocohnilembus persalinus]|uniref:Uncharacterized protein n=1 Tax=Pseudocohnilembus persalinus TaxID=266149 RepID=A0A0V0Q8C4_PSEPJ|nr:hypothetical protein PPERSA_12390 [Pseudocohnilembus persalinus]|eukprot:KRW98433.1 hypothetical protein PPERSA_12390 [Pseudocohnilembus persalinus]